MKRAFLGVLGSAGVLLAGTAFAQQDRVVVSVNGQPIKQSEVLQRLWKQYGPATVEAMVDDDLVAQAVKKNGIKTDMVEVDRRVKQIRDQFPDEQTFRTNLQKSGTNLDDLKKGIEEQVTREELVEKVKGIKVTEADVKSYFDQNREKLASPEAVRLRHLLVANEAQAKDLVVALRAGADFDKLARELSLDGASKDKGGDLGFISKGILIPEIEKVAFSLKVGDISDPIRSSLGFHILKVEEKREAEPASYKKIKDDLRRALRLNRINQAWATYIKELRGAAKIENPQAAAASGGNPVGRP